MLNVFVFRSGETLRLSPILCCGSYVGVDGVCGAVWLLWRLIPFPLCFRRRNRFRLRSTLLLFGGSTEELFAALWEGTLPEFGCTGKFLQLQPAE